MKKRVLGIILCISLSFGYNAPIRTYASEMGQEVADSVTSSADTVEQEDNDTTGETDTTNSTDAASVSGNEAQTEAEIVPEEAQTEAEIVPEEAQTYESEGNSTDNSAPESGAEEASESESESSSENETVDQTGDETEMSCETEDAPDTENVTGDASDTNVGSETDAAQTSSESTQDNTDTKDEADGADLDEKNVDDEVDLEDSTDAGKSDALDKSDADVTAEQENEEKEVLFPAFFKEYEIDGYTLTIDADEGVLPEDVTCKVKRLDRLSGKDVDQLAKDRIGEYRGLIDAVAFDISFLLDGEEIEPEGNVRVNFLPSQEAKDRLQDHLQEMHGTEPDGGRTYDIMESREDMSAAEMSQEEILERGVANTVDYEALYAPLEEPETVNIMDYIDDESVEVFHFEDGLNSSRVTSENLDDSLEVSCETDSFSPYMFVVTVKNLIGNSDIVDAGKETVIDLSPYRAEMSEPYEEGYESPVCQYLKEALKLAKKNATPSKPYHIIMPSGTYGFCSDEYTGLTIYSNTILELQSDTVLKNDPYNMRMLRAINSSSRKGYSNYSNIKIIGGTWDANATEKDDIDYKGTIMQFNCITGLTIKDCILKDTYDSHHLLLSNARNVLISGCVFRDTKNAGLSHEALQITMESKDTSPSRDIEISGCTFSDVYYGVGCHHGSAGYPYENIYVHDCTFNNIPNRAIWAYNWKSCRIENNTMNNVSIGVDCDSSAGDDFWTVGGNTIDSMTVTSNNVISGNNISIDPEGASGDKVGIRVGGSYSQNLGGYYLHYGDKVTGNTISGMPEKAVWIQYSDNTEVKNNTITDASNDGIKLINLGKASEISGNRINAYTNYGIDVVGDSIVRYQHDNYIYDYGNDKWLHVDEDSQAVGFLVNKMYGGINEKVNIISFGREDMEKKYKSANKAIAKIKSSKAVCRKKGSVKITVIQGEAKGEITLSVKKAPKKITLLKSKTLKKGKTYQLLPTVNKAANCEWYNYKYKSSNKKIASVSKNGLVKAKRKGKTTISVKTYNGVEKFITIKVK